MNLGKVIYERVKDLPAFKSFPQKKVRESFAVCPDLMIDLRQAGGIFQFCYTVSVFSATRQAVAEAVDYIIKVGKEDIETKRWCLWLHAVKLSPILRAWKREFFTGDVTYIFRTKEVAYAEEPQPEAEPKAEERTAPKAKLIPVVAEGKDSTKQEVK